MRQSENNFSNATLFNLHKSSTGRTVWRRTVLHPVHWEFTDAINVSNRGPDTADSAQVIIWFSTDSEGKRWVSPKKYAAMDAAEATRHWTLSPQDKLFRGILDAGRDMSTLLTEQDNYITIRRVAEHGYGNAGMRHWEVSGI